MRKIDLVNNVAEKTGLSKVDIMVVIESAILGIKNSLATNENVYIRGFGSFIVKKRAAKIGRNVRRNTTVHIPAHNIPAFKPAKEFVEEIKKIAVV